MGLRLRAREALGKGKRGWRLAERGRIIAPVTVEASATRADPPRHEAEAPAQEPPRLEARIAAVLLSLLPGALVVYFSFSAGGFFPSSVGFATLIVLQMIVLRMLVAENPFAGYTRRLGITALVFTGFALFTLGSQLWSDTQDRAMIEFDRALLYLALLVLLGLMPRRAWRMPWIMRGVAIGILFVCTCALITRVLPRVWPVSDSVAVERLSFPVTYWNALGILAGVGAILALGIAANPRERRWACALAAAFVPVAATTLFFTFSRGAIVATAIGVIAYLVVARSSSLPGTLLAIAPPTLVALVVAYDADQLAGADPTSDAAVAQGHDVALAVLLCAIVAAVARFLTVGIDRKLAARKREPWSRNRKLAAAGATAAVLVVVGLAAGAPSWASDQVDAFLNAPPPQGKDFRSRLTDPSSNGRKDHWRVALKGFSQQPLHGNGAGTYEYTWDRYRNLSLPVTDAHSLYFEVLDEFGVVGFLLIVATIVLILTTLLRNARGPNRMVYAALFAAGLAWAIHAGVDWDWEMPAVTAWFFAIGGAALAGRQSKRRATPMGDRGRIPIAAALLVVAVTPALLMLSQYRLQASARSFDKGNCKSATSDAISSINILGNRPQPYQIVGYCDLASGRSAEAVAAFRKAIEEQPRSWEYHFGLSIALGFAGSDPRPEMATAARLTRREPLVTEGVGLLKGKATPPQWLAAARKLNDDARVSNRLTIR
jgi:O-antigen ligase